jgi:hypothetical protein
MLARIDLRLYKVDTVVSLWTQDSTAPMKASKKTSTRSKSQADMTDTIALNHLMKWRSAAAITNKNPYTASAVEDPSSKLEELLYELIWMEASEASNEKSLVEHNCLGALDQFSKAFGQLVRILNDCIDRGQIRRGYELAWEFYQFACLMQLHVGMSFSDQPIAGLHQSRIHKGHMLFELHRMAKLLDWQWHASYYLALAFLEDVFTFLCTMSAEVIGEDQAELDAVAASAVMQQDFTSSRAFLRFWAATGSCENYRIRLGVTKGQVHQMIKKVLVAVFADVPQSIAPDERFVFAKRMSNGAGWNPLALLFPEWTYGRVAIDAAPWLDAPSSQESAGGAINKIYWAFLCKEIQQLESARDVTKRPDVKGELSNAIGIAFEELSRYACETIPGVRVQMRAKGKGGEIDMVGFIGSRSTFLYDTIGPYFCGECKWENVPMSVDEIEVISSRARRIACKSFLCFTKEGVSGSSTGAAGTTVLDEASKDKIVGVVFDRHLLCFDQAINALDDDLRKNLSGIRLGTVRGYPSLLFAINWQKHYENQRIHLYHHRVAASPRTL